MKKKKMWAAVAGACLILLQGACGGNSGNPSGPSQSPSSPAPSLGSVDPALVGTWTGTVQGSFGPGTLTMTLGADSSAWFQGSGNYCRADGNWGVTATKFNAWGSDCTGTVITKVAPASSTRLTGTWIASSGRSGTFSLVKQ